MMYKTNTIAEGIDIAQRGDCPPFLQEENKARGHDGCGIHQKESQKIDPKVGSMVEEKEPQFDQRVLRNIKQVSVGDPQGGK